ncbi:MAG: T9SS type A sorting domain-containing protein [Bacteroidota bacterium]
MKQKLLFLFILCNYAAFGQITIGSGSAVDTNAGLSSPISNWYNYSLSQTLYLASEINASGTITSLEFPLNNSNSLTNSDDMITVWIGHTTKAEFSSTVGATGADIIDVNTLTRVMDNGSLVKTGSNTVYTLTTPFLYNGIDNLIIVVNTIEPGNDGSSTLYLQSATTTSKAMMIRSDTVVFDALNPTRNFTGTNTATSWQQKTVRPIVTINGLTPLAVSSFGMDNDFRIYPNPATDVLNLGKVFNNVEIYDILGKLIFTDRNSERIAISAFAKGMYLIKVTDENGIGKSSRFLKN